MHDTHAHQTVKKAAPPVNAARPANDTPQREYTYEELQAMVDEMLSGS